jgi:2,3-dihydroxybenzoate decarboxylase
MEYFLFGDGTRLIHYEIFVLIALQIKDKPKHFGVFAALRMHDPMTAAAELRRTVTKYGLKAR